MGCWGADLVFDLRRELLEGLVAGFRPGEPAGTICGRPGLPRPLEVPHLGSEVKNMGPKCPLGEKLNAPRLTRGLGGILFAHLPR